MDDLAFQHKWWDRKVQADYRREPLYVTPEEYAELREWAALKEAERQFATSPRLGEIGDYIGTQIVVDRERAAGQQEGGSQDDV